MMSLSLMESRMCMYQESEPFLRRIAPWLLTGIHAWKVSPLLTLEDKLRSRIGGRNIALHSSNASSFNWLWIITKTVSSLPIPAFCATGGGIFTSWLHVNFCYFPWRLFQRFILSRRLSWQWICPMVTRPPWPMGWGSSITCQNSFWYLQRCQLYTIPMGSCFRLPLQTNSPYVISIHLGSLAEW